MSARRPRVKAIANIGVKRKIKEEILEKHDVEPKSKEEPPISNKLIKVETLPLTPELPTPPSTNITDEDTKNISIIDHSDENIKSSISDLQQIRHRQRIKATPCFDVRRNSIHGQNDEQQIENVGGQMKEPKLPPPSVQNLFNSNRSPIANRTRTESVSSITQQQQNVPSTITAISNSSAPLDHHHQQQQYFHNSYPPSREHIPPRHRKISTMEDAQRLSAARKEFNSKYSRKTPEKSVLKMFEFIYYNPSSNPMKFDEKCTASSNKLNTELSTKLENDKTIEKNDDSKENSTETENNNELDTMPNALPVPQLKLGPNGEIILDEKSLLIETTAEKQIRSNLAASKNFIYLDEYSGNNGFYSRQKRTKDWSPEETIKFYRCLHTVGTDFSLMLALFPNRSRRDLKLKFKKEEKFNGNLINKAILYPKAFDIEELKREFEREEKLIEEKRKQWQEIDEQKQQQQQNNTNFENNNKSSSTHSKAARVLRKGDLAYKNENLLTFPVQKKIRKKRESKKSKKNDNKIKNEIIKTENDDENNDNNDDLILSEDRINENLNHNELIESTSCGAAGSGGGSVEITDIGEIFSFGDILPELKGCSLALVSSIDDHQNIDKVTHEIYIVCKKTGKLSNKPLDLPKDTIHCILLAMGKIEET